MAGYWKYRILGEEFGPVAEPTLKALIVDGTIGPADEVRQDSNGEWQRADSLSTEEHGNDALDLDAMLGASAAPAAAKPHSSTSETTEPSEHDLDALLGTSEPAGQRKAVANEWYYRTGGRRFGPLDFDSLFEHAAERKFSRYDEIRAPGETEWVEAQSIVGLFADESAELDTMLTDSQEHFVPPPRPKKVKHRWYYRVLNQEMGPVDFEALFDLVMEGNLRADDDVRLENEPQWNRADTITGLFPDELVTGAAETAAPALATEEEADLDDDEDAEWYVKIDGQESGPVTFGRLLRMAASDKLQRQNEIRLTKLGSWMEADSMVGLFPEAEPDVEPEPAAVEPPPSSVPDRPTGDADDWAAAVLSEPAPEPPPAAAIAEPVSAAPRPEPARPATPPSPPPQRPSFTPAPKAKKSGPSFSLPSGLGSTLTDPKLLGAAGVVLLMVGLFFVPWGGLLGAGAGDLIAELDTIWAQTKALYEKKAPESEWAALATQVDPKLKEIAQTAKDRGAGPSKPDLTIAYLLASDHVPKVLESKSETPEVRIKTVDNFLSRGKELTK